MAKNGLLSEFRQDQGDDLPFVMSEVSEIKHLLPALPGEGPYPKNTYNVLEDLETADPEKAHRYVLGLVDEGHLVQVPTGEGDASGSTTSSWRLTTKDVPLPQDLWWGAEWATKAVRKLPKEPTFKDLLEALKAPRHVPAPAVDDGAPPSNGDDGRDADTPAASAPSAATGTAPAAVSQGRVLVPETQQPLQSAPTGAQRGRSQPPAPQSSLPAVVPSTYPDELSQVPPTQGDGDSIMAQPGTQPAGEPMTPEALRALVKTMDRAKVTPVTKQILAAVTTALPVPDQSTQDLKKEVSFARLRLFWHRLRHAGVIPEGLFPYVRSDDPQRFEDELMSEWADFAMIIDEDAFDWEAELDAAIKRIENDDWNGLYYPEDDDPAWVPTIGTGRVAKATDAMDVDEDMGYMHSTDQEEVRDMLSGLPEGTQMHFFEYTER